MDFLVGTFNQGSIFLLHFTPPSAVQSATLQTLREHPAIGGHSWLSLSADKQHLYATVWSADNKPAVAAYHLRSSGHNLQFLNSQPIPNLSGYVCSNATHVFSVGGATGDVFPRLPDGSLGARVQTLDFVTGHNNDNDDDDPDQPRAAVPHGDFGGLRHGAHSADLRPDGTALYVADIGRNCIWTYRVRRRDASAGALHGVEAAPLEFGGKFVAPRTNDGPRHAWPHPNGEVLYSLQEHSCMVDVFGVTEDGVRLEHRQGVAIIPAEKDCRDFWADEVRCSTGPDAAHPRYLYASTRGLAAETMGYVAVFKLRDDGMVEGEQALHIWETPTSGGLANAIEPAPWREEFGAMEYLAMTDSQEGWVFILSFDGKEIREVLRVNLGKTKEGKVTGAATAVWL